jgi:hypothetical protein
MLSNKNRKQFFIKMTASCFILLLAVFLLPNFVSTVSAVETTNDLGSEIQANLDVVGEKAELTKTDPRTIIGNIIKIFLGILGIIALVIVLYAGFLYMTSGGKPDQIEKAKKLLMNAGIGLVIILSAYSITVFFFNAILGEDGGGLNIASYPQGYSLSGGAFGDVIVSHYPRPEQTDVARNTMIIVTFREEIDPSSVIKDDPELCPGAVAGDDPLCGAVNMDTFKVYSCDSMLPVNFPAQNPDGTDRQKDQCVDGVVIVDPEDETSLVDGYILVSDDYRSVIFVPYGTSESQHSGSARENFLGNEIEDVSYIVSLSAITKRAVSGASVFGFGNPDYKWRFTTSTILDLIPPKVTSVVPISDAGIDPAVDNRGLDSNNKVYLNQIVVVNFDEPVLPMLIVSADCASPLDEATITSDPAPVDCMVEGASIGSNVPGDWKVGVNAYRTMQYISRTRCEGVSYTTCGEPAYCLPANSTMSATMITATGVATFDGIMDAAGNPLDGDGDGEVEGQDFDNYPWAFATGDSLDLIPPYITAISPDNNQGGIEIDELIRASFNEDLDPNSVDLGIKLFGDDFDSWFDPNMGSREAEAELADGRFVYDNNGDVVMTSYVELDKIVLSHGPFTPMLVGDPNIMMYYPVIRNAVRDLRQNCMNPAATTSAISSPCMEGTITEGSSCCPDGSGNLIEVPGVANCSLPGEEVYACSDGDDNDDDGLIDYGYDGDCSSPTDNDESEIELCRDGLDNDGDGDIDYPEDSDCLTPTTDTEG